MLRKILFPSPRGFDESGVGGAVVRMRGAGSAAPPDHIVDELVQQAISSGAIGRRVRWSNFKPFPSGSTAQAVGNMELNLKCVFKMDTAPKLVNRPMLCVTSQSQWSFQTSSDRAFHRSTHRMTTPRPTRT